MEVLKRYHGFLAALLVAALLGACTPKKPETAVEPTPAENATIADFAQGDVLVEPLEPEVKADPEVDDSDLSVKEQVVLESKFGLLFDLEPRDTDEVQQYFTYFTHKARKTFDRWLKRSEPYLPYVRRVFTRYGLPQDLVLLPFSESGYNARAYSWAGAGGMWQFMPYTGRKYGLKVDWWIDERRDPYKSTEAAAKYLQALYERFGDWYLALAAYNAGEGKISRALKKSNSDDFFELCNKNKKLSGRVRLKKETRHYVPKFIAISKIFQNLDSLGFEPVKWDVEHDLVPMDVPGGTDLLAFASAGEMSWKEFHDLNPAFRRQVSPPSMVTTAYVPVAKADKMLAYLANPGSRPYAGYISYQVRNGDSWWRISRNYGVPVSVLKKVNNKNSNTLRPGQRIMIPGRGSSRSVAAADSAQTQRTRANASRRGNYIVQKGDTLWAISQRFKVSVSTLRKANGIYNTKSLRPGQKLYIPDNSGVAAKQTAKAAQQTAKAAKDMHAQLVNYKVRRGDNLYSIAKRFGVSVSELRKWNALEKNTIYAGQRLKVYVR